MNQFKRVQVIMLPTQNKSYLFLEPNNILRDNPTILNDSKRYPNQHLHIASDDEIKEGDWYFDGTDFIHKKSKHNNTLVDGNKQAKKIIATTDTSLNISHGGDFGNNVIKCLPQPSQQFIEKYIEEYNKGNIIEDVLVEYETLKTTANNKHFGKGHIYSITNKLKINPKDNTITIKKLKDSWNREEVKQFAIKAFQAGFDYCGASHLGCPDESNWIEENL